MLGPEPEQLQGPFALLQEPEPERGLPLELFVQPQVGLEEGVTRLVDWYSNRQRKRTGGSVVV